MAAVDDVAFIFKRKYSNDKVSDQTKRDHLFQEMATIREGCGGEDYRYTVRTTNSQAIGGTFATAQAQTSTLGGYSKGVQFATEPALKYGFITLDGPSMARSKGNDNAFYDLVTMEVDGVLQQMGDDLAFDLYRANGIRGRRSSINSNTVTLTNAADVRNFFPGMTVGASDQSDGSSPRSGTTTVASISRTAGTITLTSAAAITSFADSDYLFRAGDPGTPVDGLGTLIPLTAASTIRGATVSTDPERLQGWRISDGTPPIEENTGLLGVNIRTEGKRANCAFWHPHNFWAYCRRAMAKVEYHQVGEDADYGFEFVRVVTPAGSIKVYSDPDCPIDLQYVGDMGKMQLRAIEEYVHIIDDDGKRSNRQASADGVEYRARSMSQPVITDPGCWGVAAVS